MNSIKNREERFESKKLNKEKKSRKTDDEKKNRRAMIIIVDFVLTNKVASRDFN
jgi:hypothetical protein